MLRQRRDSKPRASNAGPATAVRGRLGEKLAAEYLTAHGYRLVARNLRTRQAEIDVLVRRRRCYVAVEVKTRSSHPAPEHLVDDQMVGRLAAALRKLTPVLLPRPRTLRVDVVAVRLLQGDVQVRHFPGRPFSP